MSRALSFLMLLWTAALAACADGLGLGSTHSSSAVTVTSVTPYNGPLVGGTAVTILGDFPARIDSVRIGTGRLRSLVRVTESVWGGPPFSRKLTGTAPPSASAGAVDVTVYSAGAGGVTCRGCFTYKPPATWISLAVGNLHTCGLTSGGTAYCWGRNFERQLGDGSAVIDQPTPVAVSGGLTFASLAPGSYHTCGLTSGGAAYCWGPAGLLGDSSQANRIAVAGGLTFASLTAGATHTCGVTNSGAAYCWGANDAGQLGDSSAIDRFTPTAVVGGIAFTSLTAGTDHTCGLTSDGAAYCWGGNRNGQLGLGDTLGRLAPAAVAGGLTFTSLTASYGSTCGLGSGGAAYCWGNNGNAQLGDGTNPAWTSDGHSLTDRSTPVAVTGGLTFASLAAGFGRAFGLTSDGVAYSWGWQPSGTNSPTPLPVDGGLVFASLTAHDAHTCGVTSGGAAYCWGLNNFGQLGDGSYVNRRTPVAVASP